MLGNPLIASADQQFTFAKLSVDIKSPDYSGEKGIDGFPCSYVFGFGRDSGGTNPATR
jgi:hypothetical protein